MSWAETGVKARWLAIGCGILTFFVYLLLLREGVDSELAHDLGKGGIARDAGEQAAGALRRVCEQVIGRVAVVGLEVFRLEGLPDAKVNGEGLEEEALGDVMQEAGDGKAGAPATVGQRAQYVVPYFGREAELQRHGRGGYGLSIVVALGPLSIPAESPEYWRGRSHRRWAGGGKANSGLKRHASTVTGCRHQRAG